MSANKKKEGFPGKFIVVVVAIIALVFILNNSALFGADIGKQSYNRLTEVWDFNMGLITGIWIPNGNNSLLGAHPQVGLYMGTKACRFEWCVSFAFRFAPSENVYTVKHEGTQYSTDEYLGWYAGVDIGYEIFYWRRHGILLLGGAGWDAFQAKTFSDEEYVWINSINLNTGLGYRLYFEETADTAYIEFDSKYNFIDYKNPGGTNLSGNAISFNILWGIIFSG